MNGKSNGKACREWKTIWKSEKNEMANSGLEGHVGFGANRRVAAPI